jgi:ABC-type polysaccharide/polyol phosphate export permease
MPAVILIELPLVSGLALGLAALNVHFKDVRDLLANLLTLLFFLTPVLYSIDSLRAIPAVFWPVRLNPFTPFALAYQETLFLGRVPPMDLWLQMGVVSLLAWMAGAWLFDRLRETLVEAA